VLSYSSSPRHLAYELGYWFNHWLSHKVPLLGEFHKVHHNAKVLTPLTNFRVHPVCTWVFTNILAVSAAVANGFGKLHIRRDRLSVVGYEHHPGAVHSRLRPAFAHVDCVPRRARAHLRQPRTSSGASLGQSQALQQELRSCLALWDWMFGTLYAPEKTREPLTFGFPGQPDARASWSIRSSMRRATSGRSGLRTCPPCRLLSASRPS